MKSVRLQLAAVLSSFLLVLPPGWCAGVTHPGHATSAASVTCCHSEQPSKTAPCPASPTVRCCCHHDLATPKRLVWLAPVDTAVQPLFLDAPTEVAGRSGSPISIHPGPRLHLLQCVWRC